MGTKKNLVVVTEKSVVERIGNQSLTAFRKILATYDEVDEEALIQLREDFEVSIPYVGRLLKRGHSFQCIKSAYDLTEELGPLYNPDSSRGSVSSEFKLAVRSGAELISLFFSDDNICEDDMNVLADALRTVSESYDFIMTWSTLINYVIEAFADKDDGIFLCQPDSEEMSDVIIEHIERFTDLQKKHVPCDTTLLQEIGLPNRRKTYE